VTIETLKKTSPQQWVNLKATAKSVSRSKVVKVQTGSSNKSTVTLADPTGLITAAFWLTFAVISLQQYATCMLSALLWRIRLTQL